jgi:hypothetical protein
MRLGTQLEGNALWSTYVSANAQPQAEDYRYDPVVIPVYGAYARFIWKTGARRHGTLLPQAPFGPPEKCYGHLGCSDPGAASLSRGGTILQFPWSIGRTYREFGTTEVRDYFLNEIRNLAGGVISMELPEQVEAIIGRDAGGLVIHLLNQTGARRKSFGPHVPVEGGKLRIKGASAAVETLVSRSPVSTHLDGDVLTIELPRLELFEVVRVALPSTKALLGEVSRARPFGRCALEAPVFIQKHVEHQVRRIWPPDRSRFAQLRKGATFACYSNLIIY